MLYKIYGFGIKGYVRDPFNSFDGTLVIFSLIDLMISTLSSGGSSGIGALSAFRTLRMLRVVKLATKSDDMLILLTVTFFPLLYLFLLGNCKNFENCCLFLWAIVSLYFYQCFTWYGILCL
jgi:hypothetical protein